MTSEAYHFLRTPVPADGSFACASLDDDPKIALLAVSVARQQAAGFNHNIDIRQFVCPDCRSAGFNSGWGYIEFVCGAEVLSNGEPDKPCLNVARDAGLRSVG